MNSGSNKIHLSVVLCLLCLCAEIGLGQSTMTADRIAASGQFDGQLYTNRDAGFSILVPGGWVFMSEADNKAAAEQGRATSRALASNSPERQNSAVEASIANTAVLFQANSKPTRPGIGKALMSSGIEVLSRSISSEQYIDENKRLAIRNPAVRLTNDVAVKAYGQNRFATFELAGEANGKPFKQRYIALVHRGRAIFFVFTLLDDSYDRLVENSLASFKLLK